MNFNVAGRAGRWSAAHWKTAVSAWLAFCVVAIALGSVAGTKLLKQSDTAAGGSKKAEQMLNRPASPTRPARACSSSRPQHAERSRLPRDRGRRAPRHLGAAAGRARPLAVRRREQRPGVARPALRARRVRDPGRRRQGGQEGAADPRRRRGVQTRHAGLHRRRVRLRQRDARAEQHADEGLPARRVLLAAGDARRSCSSRSVRSSRPGCRCCSPSPASSRRSASRPLASHVVAAGDATKSVILLIGMAVGRRLLALLPPT